MRVKDIKDIIADLPDDLDIFISVDVRSVDPLDARRVIVDELVDAQNHPEYGVIVSMSGDWNDTEQAR